MNNLDIMHLYIKYIVIIMFFFPSLFLPNIIPIFIIVYYGV